MSHHPSGHSKQKKSKNSEEDQTKQKKMDSHKESTQSSIPNGNKSEKENLKTLNHGSVSNKEKTESKEGKESNEKKESIESKENDSNERKVPVDVRVAVIGNVDSGKSTMIGVLTSGDLDDGRGKARSRILKHNHERSNGRTSCSSQHILGFNNKKKPVHQPVAISATPKQKTTAWTTVFQSSKNIVTFIDLAGHEKYLKTTISGLTGCFPDYSFIVVGANMGISKMTREHIQVAIALGIPLFVVITKIDISPEKILKHTVKTLAKLLRSPTCNNKMPLIIRKKKEVKLLFEKDCYLERICPIFCVSAVKGDNIDILNSFLCRLKPREPWKHDISELEARESQLVKNNISNDGGGGGGESQYGELEIDETFAVRGVGIVVSGTVTAGRICSNQRMFLGPFSDSTFKEIIIRSVHMKRCSVSYARAGETCSISFRFHKRKEIVDRVMIRKGMVCVSDSTKDGTKVNISNILTPVWAFTATILVLHHPTTINEGYQPVVHCGNIRQTATIMKMSKHRLRSGDSALIDMKFLCHPEFMHVNRAIIIREGNTKCIGKVIRCYHDSNYTPSLSNFKQLQKKLKLLNVGDVKKDKKDKKEKKDKKDKKEKKEKKDKKEKKEKKEKKDDKNKENVEEKINENENNNNNNNNVKVKNSSKSSKDEKQKKPKSLEKGKKKSKNKQCSNSNLETQQQPNEKSSSNQNQSQSKQKNKLKGGIK